MRGRSKMSFFFFFNDTATTEIYTLSYTTLFRSPPCISRCWTGYPDCRLVRLDSGLTAMKPGLRDRKSTRLNSSHSQISYAVFCLKKKKKHHETARAYH